MEQALQIGLWVAGTFFAIITGLLAWIGLQNREAKDSNKDAIKEFREAWLRHDDQLKEQQKEIHENSQYTRVAIELIKQEQKQGQERLKIFQENFLEYDKSKRRK